RSTSLAVLRLGLWVVRWLHFVVDLDRRAVSQLEHSRSHNFLAGVHSGDNRYLVSTRALDFYELLAHAPECLAALWVLNVRDYVDGVTIRCIVNGRGGQGDYLTIGAQAKLDLNKHAGTQSALRIRESRLYLNVPRGFVYNGVHSGDPSGKLDPG